MKLVELAKAHNWNIPTICCRCGSELFLNASGFPECPDPNCPAKLEHQLAKFFRILDVKIAGPAFIKEAVKTIKDMTEPFDYFLNVITDNNAKQFNEWAGGINGEKILEQLKPYFWYFADVAAKIAPKSITTSQFLAMFDYPSLSVKQFEKLKNLSIKNLFKYTKDELNNTDGIGEKLANEIIKFRDEYENDIRKISGRFNIIDEEEKKTDTSLPTICFTGTCPGYSRTELTKLCEGKYNVVNSVTKDLNILACADPSSGSSKLQKAAKNGTKVVSYTELLEAIK